MPGPEPLSFHSFRSARFFVLSLLFVWMGLGLSAGRALASEAPLIVVTQKPLTLLVSELVGQSAALVQVIPDGASPHEFSLSWSGRRQLGDADLVVWGGAALEPQLASVMATLPAEKVFDASAAVTNWPLTVGCHEHGHEDSHSAGAVEGTGHADTGHGHHDAGQGGPTACLDPHFWLNPRNMAEVAEALLKRLRTLATVDEASPASLQGLDLQRLDLQRLESSAQTLLERIETLDQHAQTMLRPLSNRFYVVEHDAYNHFSQHYGLMQPGFLRAGHGMPIGPRSFSAFLARTDIGCVFTEPEYSPKLAQRLAEHTGAPLQELDPLGSQIELAVGYSGFMTRFVAAFADCFPVEEPTDGERLSEDDIGLEEDIGLKE